ncbi:MAG: hypothetical protein COB37_11515 [Kordiimonadales bacterium]|nr:MAG: hypothetical protein COB37_11515 [Kordiimonadales bacterium]
MGLLEVIRDNQSRKTIAVALLALMAIGIPYAVVEVRRSLKPDFISEGTYRIANFTPVSQAPVNIEEAAYLKAYDKIEAYIFSLLQRRIDTVNAAGHSIPALIESVTLKESYTRTQVNFAEVEKAVAALGHIVKDIPKDQDIHPFVKQYKRLDNSYHYRHFRKIDLRSPQAGLGSKKEISEYYLRELRKAMWRKTIVGINLLRQLNHSHGLAQRDRASMMELRTNLLDLYHQSLGITEIIGFSVNSGTPPTADDRDKAKLYNDRVYWLLDSILLHDGSASLTAEMQKRIQSVSTFVRGDFRFWRTSIAIRISDPYDPTPTAEIPPWNMPDGGWSPGAKTRHDWYKSTIQMVSQPQP